MLVLTSNGMIALTEKADQLPITELAADTIHKHIKGWLEQNKTQASDIKVVKYRNILKGNALNI